MKRIRHFLVDGFQKEKEKIFVLIDVGSLNDINSDVTQVNILYVSYNKSCGNRMNSSSRMKWLRTLHKIQNDRRTRPRWYEVKKKRVVNKLTISTHDDIKRLAIIGLQRLDQVAVWKKKKTWSAVMMKTHHTHKDRYSRNIQRHFINLSVVEF